MKEIEYTPFEEVVADEPVRTGYSHVEEHVDISSVRAGTADSVTAEIPEKQFTEKELLQMLKGLRNRRVAGQKKQRSGMTHLTPKKKKRK